MNARALAAAAVAAGALAAPVLACGPEPMAENLVAYPSVKAALRTAYLRAHPGRHVGQPLLGHTYYGTFVGIRYAVATFGAHPTIFEADSRGPWHVVRETRGAVCTDDVPLPVIEVWWLEHMRGHCFGEPG